MNESPAEMHDRLEQEAIAWHTRLNSDELQSDECGRFEHWLQQSPAHEQAYRKIEKLWQLLDAPLQADRQHRQQSLFLSSHPGRLPEGEGAHIPNSTELPASRSRNHRTASFRLKRWGAGLAIAASLLLVVAFNLYPDYLNQPWADYHTRIGEQTSVQLADGSTVHLNTDTALDVTLSDHERQIVLLHGEAEFEVAHDSNRPFRVATGNTITEALGTRFVVRYDDLQGSVTLLQGKVRTTHYLAGGAVSDSATLRPGQRIAFDSQKLAAVQSVDPANADAWRRGRLIMNFVPLKQVIAEINRYRRSQIKLIDSSLAYKEMNIAVDIQHIDTWLDALEHALHVRVHRIGPLIMLDS